MSEMAPRITISGTRQRIKVIPQRREMVWIGSLQRLGKLQIVVGDQSAAVLAPGALGKREPILRCELRELRVKSPAQDFRTLLEVAWDEPFI
jgi:hypothetical protein